jgi:hypothetical protein
MSENLLSQTHVNQLPQPERHKDDDPVHFRSFEQAAQGKKKMRDDFIIDLMNDTLMIGNEEASMTKRYLDKQPADPSDEAFTRNPDAIGNFHDDLADLITSRLRVFAPGANDDTKSFLRTKKGEFLQKIAERQKDVRQFAHDWAAGGGRAPSAAIEFRGFTVPTNKDDVNLLEREVGGVSSNIRVQAEATGSFVHWRSQAYQSERAQGEKPPLERRIYLNPTAKSSVEIFGKIIDVAERAGIVMKGKILNRSAEALSNMRSKEFSTRGDGIVLYAGKDSDLLLSLVEAVYNDHRDDFAGRGVSRVPFKIAEGVAVGNEPEGEGSLTSTRAALMNDVAKETKKVLHVEDWKKIPAAEQQQAVQIFRKKFEDVAQQRGIDPDNMAFNLSTAA